MTESGTLGTTYEKKETILSIENVSLTLNENLILRDVNAEVKDIVRPDCVQGQVICFLGPSGIGKTQLSRVIAGLQKPTSGRVLVGAAQTPVRAGMVGMVPQSYPLFEFATVDENLRIAARFAGMSKTKTDTRIIELLHAFDITQYRTFYPKHLSGGTRQRVAIVRQLICSDHFLVMDEPFSGQDLINKKRACALINSVAQMDELNTIIIVTHDITEGMSVADTVWLMGQEPDAERPGEFLPGAKLVEQYDLAKLDLCWYPDITLDSRFLELVSEIKARFLTLRKAA
jgi:polar amino acid transport system ATP-binding protein/sulfate transport system ATP-binding protein